MAMSVTTGICLRISPNRATLFLASPLPFTCRLRSKKSRGHQKRAQSRKISRKHRPLGLNRPSEENIKILPKNSNNFGVASPDSSTDDFENASGGVGKFTEPKGTQELTLYEDQEDEEIVVGDTNKLESHSGIRVEDLIEMIKDAEKNILLLNEARVSAVDELNQVRTEKEDLQGQIDILKMRLAESDAQLMMAEQEKIKYNVLREQAQGLETNTEECTNIDDNNDVNVNFADINGYPQSRTQVARFPVIPIDTDLKLENKALKDELKALKEKISEMNKINEVIETLDKEKLSLEGRVKQLESMVAVAKANSNNSVIGKDNLQDSESKFKHLQKGLDVSTKSSGVQDDTAGLNQSLQEKIERPETDLIEGEVDANELAKVKTECQGLRWKVEQLQDELNAASERMTLSNDIIATNKSLQEQIERLERELHQAEADKAILEQAKKENIILQQQVRVLEQRLLESDKEIRIQLQIYQEEVKAFQRSLEEMKQKEGPVQDMPWEFWSNLLLCIDGWMLEKKITMNDAKLLRDMAWSRDARIRDAYVQNQEKGESELIINLLKLVKSTSRRGLHVVHIAAEMAPVAKVGGLGDVVTGLGKALQKRGHLVEVILPKYDSMDYSRIGKLKVLDAQIESYFDGQYFKNKVWLGTVEGLPVYFIEPYHPAKFFWRGQFYGEGDDFRRFSYFSRAALEFLFQAGKKADIIHCHDWQTAFVAPLYWDIYTSQGLNSARIAFTCHNFEYQGTESSVALASCGLDVRQLNRPDRMQDNSNHDRVNAVKGGIVFSNIVTTVSPTYAEEVRTSQAGRGLHQTLATHSRKFHGILNGIDTEAWDPSTDPFLDFQYSAEDLSGKAENKKALQNYLGLATSSTAVPLVGCITRLVPQKGIHLIRHAIYRTLECGGQFVLLGSSPVRHIQHEFEGIANQFSGHPNIRLVLKYDEALSHYIYAGSDLFIVPSIFEPCGLTQMIAMRYGSIPIARRTGGLNDSVFDVDDETIPVKVRNGFTFSNADEKGVNYALERAFSYFREKENWWLDLVKKAMTIDFSWDTSATQYESLYEKAVAKARAYQGAQTYSIKR